MSGRQGRRDEGRQGRGMRQGRETSGTRDKARARDGIRSLFLNLVVYNAIVSTLYLMKIQINFWNIMYHFYGNVASNSPRLQLVKI